MIRKKVSLLRRRWINWKNNRRIARIVKPAFKASPFKLNPGADTQIHSLLCSRDFAQYILAMKSFLRFHENISIMVHDDGTLTKRQKKTLKKVFPGAVIIDKDYAERVMEERLRSYPYCRQFRAARIHMKQVFDFQEFCNRNKMIILDSDTLFFEYPKEVIDWIRAENRGILYVYEEKPYVASINNKAITQIEGSPFKFAQNLCGGFVCCYSDIFSLGLIESYCKYVFENCDMTAGRYYAQGIVALCVGMSGYRAKILSGKYQNPPDFSQDKHPLFRHYWHSLGLSGSYLSDAQKIAAFLAKEGTDTHRDKYSKLLKKEGRGEVQDNPLL
jgi:hypothetical protein